MKVEFKNGSYVEKGDCLELMPNIADKSVDLILCDLPYGTTEASWDKVIPFEPLWANYKRIIKPNGAIVLFGSQPFTTLLIASNLPMFKYNWFWNKKKPSGFMNCKNSPLKKVEDICVFSFGTIANGSEKLMKYYPQGLKQCNVTKPSKNRQKGAYGKLLKRPCLENPYKQTQTNYPSNLLEFAFEKNPIHETQKPVALLEYLIKTYSNEGELVLDNTMGSGSTCVAAVQTKRNFIGFEKEVKYFEIAKKRINDAYKQQTIF